MTQYLKEQAAGQGFKKVEKAGRRESTWLAALWKSGAPKTLLQVQPEQRKHLTIRPFHRAEERCIDSLFSCIRKHRLQLPAQGKTPTPTASPSFPTTQPPSLPPPQEFQARGSLRVTEVIGI